MITHTHTTLLGRVPAVFLQTACAVIHHPSSPHISLEVRLIINSGSQKSYVFTRSTQVTGQQSRPLDVTKVCPHCVSKCVSQTSMPLTLYVMPTICEPLVGQSISEQYPHPCNATITFLVDNIKFTCANTLVHTADSTKDIN